MIGLIESEWLRLRSRRLVRVLAVLALAGIVVAMVVAAVQSERPAKDELERAERRAERVFESCVQQDAFGEETSGLEVDVSCRHQADPALALAERPLGLSQLPDIVRGLVVIAILIGLVIGASSVGASWQTGTMTTILTWEPRRVRVAIVRAAVVAVGTVMLVAALLGTFVALFWLATNLRGVSWTPPGWASELAGVVARGAALAAAGSIIGGAIAMLGRNTAAALGGVFVYLAVFEGVLRGLRPSLGRVLLGDNIAAVMSPGGLAIAGTTITPGRAALVVAAYAVGLSAIATVSFQLRDVQ